MMSRRRAGRVTLNRGMNLKIKMILPTLVENVWILKMILFVRMSVKTWTRMWEVRRDDFFGALIRRDWKLGGLRLLLQVQGVPEEAEAEEWSDPARGDPSPEEPDHDSELPEGREAPSLEAQVHEPELPGEDLRGGAQEPGEPGLPREEEGAPVPLYDRDGQQSLYPPRGVRMGRGGDHNLGDDPSMGRDDLEPRTLRELLGDGRELRRGQPRLPLASVLGDGRDLRRGQRAERGRRAEYEPGSTQGENNDAGMPQHGGDQVPHSDEGGLREEEENGAPDTASTGAIGIEFGYMYGGSWISVNDLVDWLFQVGGGMDGEWPSIRTWFSARPPSMRSTLGNLG